VTDPGQSPPPPASTPAPTGPPSPFASQYPVEERGSSTVERLVYAGICIAAALVLAIPAAWVWASLADPPSAKLTATGLMFGETSFDQVTRITLLFVVVGLVGGLLMGLVASYFGRRHGLVAVVAILVASWVAATMTVWFGIHVFGPDHPVDFIALFNATTKKRTEMLHDFSQGDELVSTLALTSPVGLIAWPLGAMLGTLGGASLWPRTHKAPAPAADEPTEMSAQMPSS
jgi:hypothetical protein